MAKNRYLQIGSVLKSKDNEKEFYLKMRSNAEITILDKDGNPTETISVKAGDSMALQTPQSSVERLLDGGHITEEQAEERLDKIPAFVKFDVMAKVAITGNGSKSKPTAKQAPASSKRRTDDDF